MNDAALESFRAAGAFGDDYGVPAGEPCICAGTRRIWVISVPFVDGEGEWQWQRQSVPCPECTEEGRAWVEKVEEDA